MSLVPYQCPYCSHKIETFPGAVVTHWCKAQQKTDNLWEPDEYAKRVKKLQRGTKIP